MTAVVQPQHTARTARAKFDASAQLPIADLRPSQIDPDAHILAQVALVWPFSSSTKTLALLLADPDIRRRKSKGQVKVVFRNGCAKEVAKTKVGIGDTVKLALVGCEWKETGDVVSTPGKKINWDLEYNTSVLLEVLRGDQEWATVDFHATESDASATNGLLAYLNREDDEQPKLNGVLHHQSSTIRVPYLTPRKATGNHPTGTFIDTALEHLAEEDGYVLGRGRKRTKFARNSGAWSFVDLEAESHPEETSKVDVDNQDGSLRQSPQAEEVALAPEPATLDEENQAELQTAPELSKEIMPSSSMVQEIEEHVADNSSSVSPTDSVPRPIVTQPSVMGPPQTPRKASPLRQSSIHNTDNFETSDGSEAATTPRLLPIPSPGLPLVSPLVHRSGVEIGYFPPFDVSISQLDASSEKEKGAAIPGAETAELAAHGSPHSDGSPVVAVGISTPEEAAEGFEAKDNAHSDTVLKPHESEAAVEDHASAKKPAYEAPLWLSSLESSIDRELLLSQHQPDTHTDFHHRSQVVEVEDDDLYGAPIDIPKAPPPFETSLSVELPRSPLDVLEQFLQMSPTSAVSSSHPLESNDWQNTTSAPLQQDAPEAMAIDTSQERAAVSANSDRSPGTYPESQSPFRRNRQDQMSPVNSTRPSSSQSSRPPSLDGQIDERESFIEDINHLAQSSAHSEFSKQLVPDSGSGQYGIQSEVQLKTDVSVTTVKVDEVAHVESSRCAMDVVKQATYRSQEAEEAKEGSQHLPAVTGEEQTNTMVPLFQHVHTHEPHAQLPTPDHSQLLRLSTEPETPKTVQELTEVSFLSPRYTQEETDGSSHEPALPMQIETTQVTNEDSETVEVVYGKARLGAQTERADGDQKSPSQMTQESPAENEPMVQHSRASTSPTITRPISMLQPETASPRRTSQRLSSRMSTMAANVSNAHFTPGKPTRQLSSSPPRKENIAPTKDDITLTPSSRKHAEVPFVSTAIRELDQSYTDITPVSPKLTTTGPVFSRDAGITTPLAYFSPLRSLHEEFGHLVDVIAVCADSSAEPEQSKTGRKGYHTTLQLTDPTVASEAHSTISARVFRPVRTALPTTLRGDVVILRNFKVQTFHRRFALLSTDTSSWAVFKARAGGFVRQPDVVISGPPLEYGDKETNLVEVLFSWFNISEKERDDAEPPPQADPMEVENGSPSPRRSSPRFKEIPEPIHKVTPRVTRRMAGTSNGVGNAGENLETLRPLTAGSKASDVSDNNEVANSGDRYEFSPQPTNTTNSFHDDNETINVSVRPWKRRRANKTDNFGNEGDEDVAMTGDDWAQSIPLSDQTNRRRGSTISTAPSESGRSFTPRRSARLRKSPSLVHELRDGTKYVDDDRRSASVVHELRDGASYVDE